MRFHPFVSLPERMRTACDRSGANGKEKDCESGGGIGSGRVWFGLRSGKGVAGLFIGRQFGDIVAVNLQK